MKKLSIMAGAALFAANGALADGASVSIDELECYMPDAGLGGHVLSPPALGGDAVIQAVVTPSGNIKYSCAGTLPEEAALPARGAFVTTGDDTGLVCFTGSGATLDWHVVVTRNGRASISCHIHDEDD